MVDKEWDEAIREQSLHLKWDKQLAEMLISHQAKLPRVEKDLYWLNRFPDFKRKELWEEVLILEAKGLSHLSDVEVEEELQSEISFYQEKVDKLKLINQLIQKEQKFRKDSKVKRKPIGTTYYIDFDNGDDTLNDGSTPTKTNGDGPWATLDKFCANARSAGDKAIVRRGMIQTVSADLTFTSDGTIVAPIIIEADFDDDWSDKVDLSGTGTATLAFGSKTVTFSADISGVIAAHDWIYASGDDQREFAYEVKTVSTVTVTLYLPYKGGQAGSGKTMYNIKAAPIWNTVAGDYEVNLDQDDYWK